MEFTPTREDNKLFTIEGGKSGSLLNTFINNPSLFTNKLWEFQHGLELDMVKSLDI